MDKFEYKVVDVNIKFSQLTEQLNHYGKDGWEIYKTDTNDKNSEIIERIYLKRPIPGKQLILG